MYAYISVFTSQPTLGVISLLNFLNVIFYFTFIMCFSWILIMLIIFHVFLANCTSCFVCIQIFYYVLVFVCFSFFFLCIQTLWSEYKSLIRYIFCKYLLLLYGILLIMLFFLIGHSFTLLWPFLPYSKVNQLFVYVR